MRSVVRGSTRARTAQHANKRGNMTNTSSLRRCIVALLMLTALVSQGTWALAGTTGGISGYVRDTDGNPVANARVTASAPSEVTSTTADGSGHFSFLSLAPDTYTIGAIKDGYQDTSIAGVSVFADQVQTVSLTMPKALRTIASVRSQAASSLVKSGVGGDIYNVDPAQMQKTAALGGGGNLDSAYSAIASVPGLVVGTGGAGWNQAVVVRGNNPWFTGFEYDGIPVNRAFDNYTASTASNLGLQELQVYTGGGPSSISSSGTSGFINQVIKTGTFPGYGTLSGGVADEAFYHSARAEAGGASPNRNFSYYVGLSGYNQAFRYIDQSNGASLMTPGQPYASYGYLRSSFTGFGVEAICDPLTGASPNPLAPNCLQPFSGLFALQSSLADREGVANFHFGVQRHDGQKDDVQLLLSSSALDTHQYSSLNDNGINNLTAAATAFPFCGLTGTDPGCAATGGAPNLLRYTDAVVYDLAFGTNIAPGGTALPTQNYYQPHSPTNRPLFAPLPNDLQDAFHNDTGVVKLQWTHPFNGRSFARVYGYTFYSDWTQAGAVSGADFEYPYTGVAPNYDLITHTAGGEFQYFNQLTDRHLLQFTVNDTSAAVTRFNNTGYLGETSPIGYISLDSAGKYHCWNPSSGLEVPCAGAGSGAYKSSAAGGPTGFAPGGSPAANSGAIWATLWNGNASGTFNTVKPNFLSASIGDQWRPTDKWNINASVRFDRFAYNMPNANTGQNPFYAQILQNYSCYNPTTHNELTSPLAPGQPAPAPALLTSGDCATALPNGQSAGYVHPNGTTQDGIAAPLWSLAYPNTYSPTTWEPRLSGTFTWNPDTVLRFSAGRFAEPPISASVNYLYRGGSGVNLWGSFMDLGFLSPFHPIPPQTSAQYDFSLEHRLHGTTMSLKVTPFWQDSSNWEQQSFIGAGFVTQVPVGKSRNYGVEAQFNVGDFNRNGVSGLVSFTWTQSQVQFQNLLGQNQINLVNQAIDNYNALTKAGGGSPCYTPFSAGTGGTPDPACAATSIANPYYNSSAQGHFDPNGWYPQGLYALQPGVNTIPVFYNSPYVTNLVVNYRHDKFAITPSLQIEAGAPYGGPFDVIGQDPRVCGANQTTTGVVALSPSTNPLACDYTTLVGAGAAPQFGYLYIPNPQTGNFVNIGQFNEPNIAVANVQVTYDVSPRVTVQLTAADLWHTCFGGSKGPWTTAYKPSSTVCGYEPSGPNIGSYVSNMYNGTGPTDTAANGVSVPLWQLQSYQPKANNTIGGFFPFNLYLQAQIKL